MDFGLILTVAISIDQIMVFFQRDSSVIRCPRRKKVAIVSSSPCMHGELAICSVNDSWSLMAYVDKMLDAEVLSSPRCIGPVWAQERCRINPSCFLAEVVKDDWTMVVLFCCLSVFCVVWFSNLHLIWVFCVFLISIFSCIFKNIRREWHYIANHADVLLRIYSLNHVLGRCSSYSVCRWRIPRASREILRWWWWWWCLRQAV